MPTVLTTDIAAAAAALNAGRLVAFATETVYGLGAAAADPRAVAALYRVKNRPPAHPVIVHLADFSAVTAWAAAVPAAAQVLAELHMPGPLTLLLPRQPHLSHLPGGALIAVRVPAHPLAQQLLRAFGGGVVAPSANRFGAVSPTSAQHVVSEFAEWEEEILVLDGGDCAVGIESTIVGFAGDAAYIARPGGVRAEDIRAAGVSLTEAPAGLAAPGRLAKHYAPRTPLLLLEETEIAAHIATAGVRAAVLSPQEVAGAVVWRRAAVDAVEYARELYRNLRELDAAGAEVIIAAELPQTEEWSAVNDRLEKAAG